MQIANDADSYKYNIEIDKLSFSFDTEALSVQPFTGAVNGCKIKECDFYFEILYMSVCFK